MLVSAAKATEAAGVLAVELDGLTADAIRKAYRSKAKECHPDHHGAKQLDKWARVSWAKECLEHWLSHHPQQETQPEPEIEGAGNCRVCKGTGRVDVIKRGFGKSLKMQCTYCRGTGSLEPEEHDFD